MKKKNIFNPKNIPSKIPLNSLINDDCLIAMNHIEDNSIDLICTDLPFGITKIDWDKEVDLGILWKHYERIIKSKGNIILFGTGLFAFKLAISNEKLFRYDMIWSKSKSSSSLTAKYMPLKKHEIILVFGKPAAYYNPQLIKGKAYKRNFTLNKTNNHKFGIKGVQVNNNGTRHPSTVLEFKQGWRPQNQLYPCEKPVGLLEWIIKSYSQKNDVVLDTACGSGSCMIAAIKEHRHYIGMDLNPVAIEITKNRIENFIKTKKDYHDK